MSSQGQIGLRDLLVRAEHRGEKRFLFYGEAGFTDERTGSQRGGLHGPWTWGQRDLRGQRMVRLEEPDDLLSRDTPRWAGSLRGVCGDAWGPAPKHHGQPRDRWDVLCQLQNLWLGNPREREPGRSQREPGRLRPEPGLEPSSLPCLWTTGRRVHRGLLSLWTRSYLTT